MTNLSWPFDEIEQLRETADREATQRRILQRRSESLRKASTIMSIGFAVVIFGLGVWVAALKGWI